ncbi:MAG: N-acetylmuramoyl-L-alanine amidase [bacterium]|nr:N-acetylmuramoyl-L-alanine amidase [bacterium]
MIRLLLYSIFVLNISASSAKAQSDITVIDNVNQRRISLEFLTKDGEELLSLTDISKVFKSFSQWNPITKKITLTKGNISVTFNIGSALVQINNQTVLMDMPAELITGRVFIPVKFIKDRFPQVFDVIISWDKKGKKLTIDNKEFTPPVALSNQPTVAEYFPLSSTRPPEKPEISQKTPMMISGSITEKFRIKTIIIDPGHGGHDPGAIGSSGILEKNVVLDIGKRLAQLLKDKLPETTILMTRYNDYFVPLKDRTGFANYKKGDLFISIHANAAFSKYASGFEVFYLSPDASASDERARALAVVENKVLDLEKEKTPTQGTDYIQLILGGLAQQEFIDESIELAGIIQKTVCQRLNLDDRGIKSAFFWVLKDAMMPAVLVETGFVSNPYEAQKLNSEEFKNQMAETIGEAIIEYKTLYEKKLKVNYED